MIACAAASQPSGASWLHHGRDAGQQFVHRQLRADHARAHHKDGMLVRAQVCGNLFGCEACVDLTLDAGAGVGAAGIDEHRVDGFRIESEQLAVIGHRRGRKEVARENACGAAGHDAGHQRQVRRARLLDPRRRRAGVETCYDVGHGVPPREGNWRLETWRLEIAVMRLQSSSPNL
jgi:hypothetical protein